MAHVKYSLPPLIIVDDIYELRNQIEQEVFFGASEPTKLLVVNQSGTVDPFTEEITYHQAHNWFNASGIVGSVQEHDSLLGIDGRIQIGTVKVSYPYSAVSGILDNEVKQINLLTPGISGLYLVVGHTVDVMGHVPLFVDFALVTDQNGA